MSRRLKVGTREMGDVDLYLIYNYGAFWESSWEPLRQHPFARNLATSTHEIVEQALLGYSRPLVKGLGLFPKGMLHKLPLAACENAATCTLYVERNCLSTAKGMPWCFEPAGFDSTVRPLVAELVRLWREQVYVVVVEEPVDAR